jgi:hypothetical protein
MATLPVTSPFTPQEYQILFLSIDDNLMTEVQSISIMRTDGGADVETLVREYGGRVKGSAKAELTVKGVVPYQPTDVGGVGFSSGGMVTGNGVQLDQIILSNLNQNASQPVKFTIALGNPAVQKLFFKGFAYNINLDVSTGKQVDFSFQASGQFTTFQ